MTRRSLLAVLATAGCSFTPGYPLGVGPSDAINANDSGGSPDGTPVHDARLADAPKPIDAYVGVTLVQSASGLPASWNGNGKTIAATLTTDATAGDVIAIYVTYAGDTSLSTIADTLGNTYTIVDTVSDGANTQKSSTAYAKNIAAGADTITATFQDSKCCRLLLAHELTGADLAAPLDVHSGNQQGSTGTNADAVTAGTMTTTTDHDYIFAATSDASNAANQAITAGAGLMLRAHPTNPSGNPTVSEDERQLAAGAVTSTFTFAKNGAALSLQMAFKP